MGNELANFRNAHFFGVALVVKKDIGPGPKYVGFFCAGRVLFEVQGITILFKKFFCFGRCVRLRHFVVTLGMQVYNLYIGYYTNNLPYIHPYGVLYGKLCD